MERSVTKREVLETVLDRDRREYPVMTVTEIAERFDYSRQTVRRRVKELHHDDLLRRNSAGKGNYYWPHEDIETGLCPECHGVLERDPEYDPGFNCQRCTARYGQMYDGESHTAFGASIGRGLKMVRWWSSLPEKVRGFVTTVTTVFMDVETPPNVDYRPENLTYPGNPLTNGLASGGSDTDTPDTDTDTDTTA